MWNCSPSVIAVRAGWCNCDALCSWPTVAPNHRTRRRLAWSSSAVDCHGPKLRSRCSTSGVRYWRASIWAGSSGRSASNSTAHNTGPTPRSEPVTSIDWPNSRPGAGRSSALAPTCSGADPNRGHACASRLARRGLPTITGRRTSSCWAKTARDSPNKSTLGSEDYALTRSASSGGPGGVPSPKGLPPSASRPCGVNQPARSGPLGTMRVGLMSACTM
jgi:hypothetical protein